MPERLHSGRNTATLRTGAVTRPAPVTLRRVGRIGDLDAALWNRLASGAPPFLRHEFLAALETCGAVGAGSGWLPHFLLAERDGVPVGALPLYLKSHSFGEFVFDWAWASAHERHGIPYYPKFVVAVPYTPVTGPRLLLDPAGADPATVAAVLADGALGAARERAVSSLHWLFVGESDRMHLAGPEYLHRTGCQFHWDNPGYRDFADFLDTLTARARKEIRRERRAVTAQGITVEVRDGAGAGPEVWDDVHRFYSDTFLRKGNRPPLTRGFFADIAATMGERILLILAHRDGRRIGAALFLAGDDALYGRHWGADGDWPCLHFELCYYRAIEYCIERRLARFEAGAQGEYKVRRGFRPVLTHSLHWIADPRFAAAIGDFVAAERDAVRAYCEEMRSSLPYRESR